MHVLRRSTKALCARMSVSTAGCRSTALPLPLREGVGRRGRGPVSPNPLPQTPSRKGRGSSISATSHSPPAACAPPPHPAPGAASARMPHRAAGRDSAASVARCWLPLSAGPSSRITRSTGRSSIAAKSIGRASRTNSANGSLSASSRACGRAKPLPRPVDPRFSRACNASKMARRSSPSARGRPSRQFLQQLRLVGDAQPDHDPVRCDDLADRHQSGARRR